MIADTHIEEPRFTSDRYDGCDKSYWFSRLVFRSLRICFRILPLRWTSAFCAAIAKLIAFADRRDREIALAQLAYVKRYVAAHPAQYGDCYKAREWASPDTIVYESFGHYGRCLAEILHWRNDGTLPQMTVKTSEDGVEYKRFSWHNFDFEGLDYLYRFVQNKQGCITLSAHFGNFELMAGVLANMGAKIMVLGREPNDPRWSNLLELMRSELKLAVVWRDDSNAVKRIIKAIETGYIVAGLIDQDTFITSVYTEVFGLRAAHPFGSLRIAEKMRCPIMTCFTTRGADGRHRIVSEPVLVGRCETRTASKGRDRNLGYEDILKVYSARFEATLLSHPAVWPWWHRRWRREEGVDYHLNPEKLRGTGAYLSWLNSQCRGDML